MTLSYGRHQSFFLKKNWINKGLKALENDGNNVFTDKDMYKELGIGKNMHQALRYWLETLRLAEHDRGEKTHNITKLGELIKNYDPAVTSDFTKSLVHYFLVKYEDNSKLRADAFYWFFAESQTLYVTKESFLEGLERHSKGQISQNTLNKDIDCLFQTYTKKVKSHPEDKNVSLLADLELLRKEGNTYVKIPLEVNALTSRAFYYVLNTYPDELGINYQVEEITGNIGCLFNWSQTHVIDAVENLIKLKYPIEITRTNNLDTIRINDDLPHDNDGNQLLQNLFEEVFTRAN